MYYFSSTHPYDRWSVEIDYGNGHSELLKHTFENRPLLAYAAPAKYNRMSFNDKCFVSNNEVCFFQLFDYGYCGLILIHFC